jgi:uncharacterized RDD family membrane protein YckC
MQVGLQSESNFSGTVVVEPDDAVDRTRIVSRRSGDESPVLKFGQILGGYQIQRLLGKGGMGEVYEAVETKSGRRLALKALTQHLDPGADRQRFFREGRLAASVNHPNSVYVYGVEEVDGLPIITMELVSGGTLKERVQEKGPMPIAEAVDAILQIIDGLQAAQEKGVLHRDIKPSNCFVDADGRVKVGDFGLSVSTLNQDQTQLTLTGTVVGTPAFCSPEQIRGDELDVRSDIYSVAVTLYFLLTRRAPFEASNVVHLLAAALENQPESPARHRDGIPEELVRVILRGLAKLPGERFRNYGELRQALTRFSSRALVPARMGMRTLAGLADNLIGVVFFVSLSFWIRSAEAGMDPAIHAVVVFFLPLIGGCIFSFLYYAIPEGLWGASPGKALCGLSVLGPDGEIPGLGRASLRALIFVIGPSIPHLIYVCVNPVDAMNREGSALAQILEISTGPLFLLLFATMRQRNGFAAVHDLASGSRVVVKAELNRRTVMPVADDPVSDAESSPRIGPYHLLRTLGVDDSAEMLLGYDLRLLRKVWIRKLPVGSPALSLERQSLGRVGRLRWLNGKRDKEECWDAYEAPPGQPLTDLIQSPQSWSVVRDWLMDLAVELSAAGKDGSLLRELSLDRVWITVDGWAKLLDFPGPSGDRDSTPETPGLDGSLEFLKRLARESLVESGATNRTSGSTAPLPLHAHEFLQRLYDGASLDEFIASLDSTAHRPTHISRKRRFSGIVAVALIPIMLLSGLMAGGWILRDWMNRNPHAFPMMFCLDEVKSLEKRNPPEGSEDARNLAALHVHVAGEFGGTIGEAGLWGSSVWKFFFVNHRELAERIVQDTPRPSEPERARAGNRLAGFLKTTESETQYVLGLVSTNQVLFIFVFVLFLTACLPALVAALVFRGGLLMHALGFRVVTNHGDPASTSRVLWRAQIAWSPILLILGMNAALHADRLSIRVLMLGGQTPAMNSISIVLLSVFVLGAVYAVIHPQRSFQDRLAGTSLAPK